MVFPRGAYSGTCSGPVFSNWLVSWVFGLHDLSGLPASGWPPWFLFSRWSFAPFVFFGRLGLSGLSGLSGLPGLSGLSGVLGFSGFSGFSSFAGLSGLSGPSGI